MKITVKDFIEFLEQKIEPCIKNNTEASYEEALDLVRSACGRHLVVTLTKNQVRLIVNRAWNKYYRRPIACWSVCNVASLNVYSIVKDGTLLVGLNNDEPKLFTLQYDEGEPFISYFGAHYYLSECMRVGALQ